MIGAYYGGVTDAIRAEVRARLAPDLWRVVEAFEHRYRQHERM